MQLVAYGAQDIYLTGNPQITFFKVVYRRHTNFSMEAIEQTLAGTAGASATQTCTISRNGDLVYKVWIEEGSGTANSEEGCAYTYIKNIDCEIGGQLIDRQTGDWNAVWWNLTTPESKVNGFKNSLIGISGTADTTKSNNALIYYPLNFWFCRNVGLALPLIALQYHEVTLKITYGAAAIISSPKVWIDYIYLDTDERRRFAQVSHEYLIEQVQRDTFPGDKKSFDLKFNHPVKELIFVNDLNSAGSDTCQFGPIGCTDNLFTKTTTDSYSDADARTMRLVLNGHDRFAPQNMKYFKTYQPLEYHTRCPAIGNTHTLMFSDITNGPATTGVFPLFVPFSHIRITKATIITTAAATGDLTNITLGSSNVEPDTAAIIAGNAIGTTGAIAASTTTFISQDFNFNTVGNFACIAAGKAVYITATADEAFRANLILEYEELPTLIGGNPLYNLANIYCYSFALKPEEHQPSGTCNFSRIDSAQLIFNNNTGNSNTTLKIFAVNYNILRIMSGMGGLAYSN